MRRPENDVALIDGEGYMVTDRPYHKHLRVVVETKEVINAFPMLDAPDVPSFPELAQRA
jgi:hypothetical protein